MEKYLRETKMLDYSSKNIQRLIQERNWNDIEVFERLKSIYNFVRDEILFGYNIDDNISASKVLATIISNSVNGFPPTLIRVKTSVATSRVASFNDMTENK